MKYFRYTTLALSCFLTGCITAPGTIQELSERQENLEAEVGRMSDTLTDVQRKLEIQSARIRNLEQNYSDIYLKLDELRAEPPASEPPASAPEGGAVGPPAPTAVQAEKDLYLKAGKLYNQGQFLNAILAYQVFIDTYPDDSRVADAYLKQGLSLVRIGRKDGAKFFFRTLITRFPNTPEAQRAREELKSIDSE
ncbi:MAG TPA: tetratricopeptide repeat protein [Thermodesulfobacteriota bacterium]|nr:tetratricopeptide repeat protein [Thermodesulfobacteriota bacterium]